MEDRKVEFVWDKCPECKTETPMIKYDIGDSMRYRCVNCNILFEKKFNRKRQWPHP